MRTSISLAIVSLVACRADLPSPDVESANGAGLLLLGATMTLETTPWVGTLSATVTVTGGPANTSVTLLSSPKLTGAGVCSPKTAPLCFDLAAPLRKLVSKKTDAAGNVTFSIAVANPVTDPALEIQAVIVGPSPEKSNSVIVDLHDLGSDNDADGLTAEDEVQIWLTDPSDPDTDGDNFFDGTEAAAGTDPLDGVDFPPTYDDVLHPDLFLVECTPCHVNGGTHGGLNLDKYGDVVNQPSTELPTMDRVEPFDPDNSYLWHKVNGTQLAVGGSGVQMPKDGPPFLTATQLALLEEWINTGALEGPDQ